MPSLRLLFETFLTLNNRQQKADEYEQEKLSSKLELEVFRSLNTGVFIVVSLNRYKNYVGLDSRHESKRARNCQVSL